MGDYQIAVIWAIGYEGEGQWKSILFFKTSEHAAKVEASALVKFRFQKDAELCELADSKHWEQETDTLWSKSTDDGGYRIELSMIEGNYNN